jgi:hypothetical protein
MDTLVSGEKARCAGNYKIHGEAWLTIRVWRDDSKPDDSGLYVRAKVESHYHALRNVDIAEWRLQWPGEYNHHSKEGRAWLRDTMHPLMLLAQEAFVSAYALATKIDAGRELERTQTLYPLLYDWNKA